MAETRIQTIEANGNELNPRSFSGGTRGSFGTVRLNFRFSPEWYGLTAKIVFYPKRGKPIEVPYLGLPIDIPAEVMKYDGDSQYIISGIPVGGGTEKYKRISLVGRIIIEHTLDDRGHNSAGMTQNSYDLFLAGASEYIDEALVNAKESGLFDGVDGKSAYEQAVDAGFDGTLDEWLASLYGHDGIDGDPGVYVSETEDDTPPDGAKIWIITGAEGDEEEDILIPDDLSYTDSILQMMCSGKPVGSAVKVVSGGGSDGYSPTAAVVKDGTVAVVTITDKNGTTTAEIHDGADGKDGAKGADGKSFRISGYYGTLEALQSAVPSPDAGDAYGIGSAAPYDVYIYDAVSGTWKNNGSISGVAGEDGYSPTAEVIKSGTVSTFTVTDKNGTTTVEIRDGADGRNGTDGKNGVDGQDGADGLTPNITIGTVTTGEEGSSAAAEIVGISPDLQLNLVIPRGNKGDKGDGASITIDTAMSDTSENAVQNKVIKAYIDGIVGDIGTAVDEINGIIGGGA